MFTHEFFEESSREFMKGKVRRGHMIYYVCEATLKSGKPCERRAVQDPLVDRLCTQHLKCQSKPEEPVKVDEYKPRISREVRQYSRFGPSPGTRVDTSGAERQYSRFGPSPGDGGAERQYSRFGRRLIPAKV